MVVMKTLICITIALAFSIGAYFFLKYRIVISDKDIQQTELEYFPELDSVVRIPCNSYIRIDDTNIWFIPRHSGIYNLALEGSLTYDEFWMQDANGNWEKIDTLPVKVFHR